MGARGNISKSSLFFLLVALSWTAASYFQDDENTEGSGLDIFLMIDCSRSVSNELQNNHLPSLANCYDLILRAIINSLRDWHRSGDRVLLGAFSNACVRIGDWVWIEEVTRKRLYQEVIAVIQGQVPDIIILDRTRTDFVSALGRELSIVKTEFEQREGTFHVGNRTQVVIIITDGKNDPRGENRSDNIIIDRQAIESIISDFRNNSSGSVKVAMFQLPVNRGQNDNSSLVYHRPTDWKEILQGLHFTSESYSAVRDSVSSAFSTLRKLVSKNVCVSSRGFRIDRHNRLKGSLLFTVPELRWAKLPLRIKLDKIKLSDNQQIALEKELIIDLRANAIDSVVINLQLPDTTNIPFGSKGKLKINYTQMWSRNSQDEYYISFRETSSREFSNCLQSQ
jgi:hypothetical protein